MLHLCSYKEKVTVRNVFKQLPHHTYNEPVHSNHMTDLRLMSYKISTYYKGKNIVYPKVKIWHPSSNGKREKLLYQICTLLSILHNSIYKKAQLETPSRTRLSQTIRREVIEQNMGDLTQ